MIYITNVHVCLLFSFSLEIQSLMLKGRTSKAISMVSRLYPGLLETNKELKFRIMCRQFIEVVSGCDRLGEGGDDEGDVAMDTDDCHDDTSVEKNDLKDEGSFGKRRDYVYYTSFAHV